MNSIVYNNEMIILFISCNLYAQKERVLECCQWDTMHWVQQKSNLQISQIYLMRMSLHEVKIKMHQNVDANITIALLKQMEFHL